MKEVFEKLKAKEIISNRTLTELRRYIGLKYPDYTSQQTSSVLADSLHKILDMSLAPFKEDYRKEIKSNILERTIRKKSFVINGEEIFNICISLEINDEDYFEELTNWVSNNQDVVFTKEALMEFVHKVENHNEEITTTSVIADETSDDIKYKHSNSDFSGQPVRNKIGKGIAISIGTFLILVSTLSIFHMRLLAKEEIFTDTRNEVIKFEIGIIEGLHSDLKYKEINIEKMGEWLNRRDSILSDEQYILGMIKAAKKYNLNPLLLFAITGQEQSFVPRSNKNAKEIANNPFNVFGSWIEYNTNIYDSSEIAARTVINLSKGRPFFIDNIQWINRKYAEDKNWWIGVSKILSQLEKELGENY